MASVMLWIEDRFLFMFYPIPFVVVVDIVYKLAPITIYLYERNVTEATAVTEKIKF